jgi:AraC-like DNA-binding protein
MEPHEISQNVESFLRFHPKASLSNTAEKLGLSPQDIEKNLREVHGTSFQEFRQTVMLNEAFRQLGETRITPEGAWEETRYHPRRVIPGTTVRYRMRGFWMRTRSFSQPLPLVDLSCGGLALLSDAVLATDKPISLMLKFLDKSEEIRLEGRTVYAVATGIASFRYRIGIQFLPFANRRGCNHPKALDILEMKMTAKER